MCDLVSHDRPGHGRVGIVVRWWGWSGRGVGRV